MTMNALVLSRDLNLRRRTVDRMRSAGDEAVDFGDGRSAFLWACGLGRVRPLEALILDETIEPDEADALARRLRVLHPGLRTIALPGDPEAEGVKSALPTEGLAPLPTSNPRAMRFVRAHREDPHQEPVRHDERWDGAEGGYATP